MGDQREVAGHAFISYVRENSLDADRLQQILEDAGVSVWRDTSDLWPGQDWRLMIRRAIIDDTLAFIACFSQASLAREKSYQNEELVLAIEQLRLRRLDSSWLIPVRFDECEIPDIDIGGGRTLRSIQHADLFGDHFAGSVQRLVAAVRRILERRPAASQQVADPVYVPDPRTLKVGQWVASLAISPDGTRLATGSRRLIRMWDLRTGSQAWEAQAAGRSKTVKSVAFSPDGARLVTANEDRTPQIWEAFTGAELLRIHSDASVLAVAFSPDGTRVASGGKDDARVWDAVTGVEQFRVSHKSTVYGVAFSSDGSLLATAGHDGMACVWRALGGSELLRIPHGSTASVKAVVFSPDCSRLATASDKPGNFYRVGSVRVWNARTGIELLHVDHGDTSSVAAVAFSPDGTRLATAGSDGTARIWDAISGTEQVSLRHGNAVEAVAFSPDGSRLITGAADDTSRVWDVSFTRQL